MPFKNGWMALESVPDESPDHKIKVGSHLTRQRKKQRAFSTQNIITTSTVLWAIRLWRAKGKQNLSNKAHCMLTIR